MIYNSQLGVSVSVPLFAGFSVQNRVRETLALEDKAQADLDKASLDKWDDYTKAKEAMFFYTDTADAPWTIIKSDDKKRARLNIISHLLGKIPYEDLPRAKVKLPKRRIGKYKAIDYPFKFVPERF